VGLLIWSWGECLFFFFSDLDIATPGTLVNERFVFCSIIIDVMRKCMAGKVFDAISLRQSSFTQFMTNVVQYVRATYRLFKNKRGYPPLKLRTQNLEQVRTATFQSRFSRLRHPSEHCTDPCSDFGKSRSKSPLPLCDNSPAFTLKIDTLAHPLAF
jgi:hypothetical protein